MKKVFLGTLMAALVWQGCKSDKDLLNELGSYNFSKESEGYRYGESIQLPPSVAADVSKVTISLGDREISDLKITPENFKLGDNAVTFNLKTKSGETLQQDATINVYAAKAPQQLAYTVVAQYPHNPANFVQGFELEGNTIYESDGQNGKSQILKYTLGGTTPLKATPQPADVFSEGAALAGDKIYQLTWQNKKGFIYSKSDLSLLGEFNYNPMMIEGWGLAFDGKNLLASDGTKNIYKLNVQDPSKMESYISVASNDTVFTQLNELEYHNGFLYANVWQKPIILKINPKTGEVAGIVDFSEIVKQNTKGTDDVLNGIAFKGENMLITGKYWNTIYEVAIK